MRRIASFDGLGHHYRPQTPLICGKAGTLRDPSGSGIVESPHTFPSSPQRLAQSRAEGRGGGMERSGRLLNEMSGSQRRAEGVTMPIGVCATRPP
jgi:hypothetical protein